jgi:site-specific recombinase XerD
VDDVLELRTEQIKKALAGKRHALSIKEKKTGKTSRRTLGVQLLSDLLEQAGYIYVFEGRDDYRKHRTRQAVFYDLKKAAKRFNIRINLSPHSLRKNYAVYLKKQGKDVEEIRKALNHDNIVTTLLYMMSDELLMKYKKSRA